MLFHLSYFDIILVIIGVGLPFLGFLCIGLLLIFDHKKANLEQLTEPYERWSHCPQVQFRLWIALLLPVIFLEGAIGGLALADHPLPSLVTRVFLVTGVLVAMLSPLVIMRRKRPRTSPLQ